MVQNRRTNENPFQKAQRRLALMRLAIDGPSGAGKTWSILAMATGLADAMAQATGKVVRVALIDTERGSAHFYADKFDFDHLQLEPPYTPAKYIWALDEAARHGYQVVGVDSLSHAWSGVGGALDTIDKLASMSKGNKWAAWREVTPEHRRLVEALLNYPGHLFASMRTKTEWTTEVVNGKSKPVKIGTKPEFRDGVEYEFSVVLDIDNAQHMAQVSKDRTHQLDGKVFRPAAEHGAALYDWLSSGDADAQAPVAEPPRGPDAPPAQSNGKASPLAQLYAKAKAKGIPDERWVQQLRKLGISRTKQPTDAMQQLAQWVDVGDPGPGPDDGQGPPMPEDPDPQDSPPPEGGGDAGPGRWTTTPDEAAQAGTSPAAQDVMEQARLQAMAAMINCLVDEHPDQTPLRWISNALGREVTNVNQLTLEDLADCRVVLRQQRMQADRKPQAAAGGEVAPQVPADPPVRAQATAGDQADHFSSDRLSDPPDGYDDGVPETQADIDRLQQAVETLREVACRTIPDLDNGGLSVDDDQLWAVIRGLLVNYKGPAPSVPPEGLEDLTLHEVMHVLEVIDRRFGGRAQQASLGV